MRQRPLQQCFVASAVTDREKQPFGIIARRNFHDCFAPATVTVLWKCTTKPTLPMNGATAS